MSILNVARMGKFLRSHYSGVLPEIWKAEPVKTKANGRSCWFERGPCAHLIANALNA